MPEDFSGLGGGIYRDDYKKSLSNWDSSYDRLARPNQNYDYASWWRRAGGAVIDYIAPWALLAWLAHGHRFPLGVFVLALWLAFTSVIVQTMSGGQSLGKMAFGAQLVHITEVGERREEYAQAPTLARVFTRQCLHIFDMAFFWCWLRPMWNVHHRTLADSMASTIVIRQGSVELRGQRYLAQEAPNLSRWISH